MFVCAFVCVDIQSFRNVHRSNHERFYSNNNNNNNMCVHQLIPMEFEYRVGMCCSVYVSLYILSGWRFFYFFTFSQTERVKREKSCFFFNLNESVYIITYISQIKCCWCANRRKIDYTNVAVYVCMYVCVRVKSQKVRKGEELFANHLNSISIVFTLALRLTYIWHS